MLGDFYSAVPFRKFLVSTPGNPPTVKSWIRLCGSGKSRELLTVAFLSLAGAATFASSPFFACFRFGDRLREAIAEAMRNASSAMPYLRLVCHVSAHRR